MSDVTLTVAVTSVDLHEGWRIGFRVIDVATYDPRDRSLIAVTGTMTLDTPIKKVPMHIGILCQTKVDREVIENTIQKIATGEEVRLDIVPSEVRALQEACVRVPLSLLKELRGQFAYTELPRRALVKVWSEDRKTGRLE